MEALDVFKTSTRWSLFSLPPSWRVVVEPPIVDLLGVPHRASVLPRGTFSRKHPI
jgi:hypothetical protein